MSENRYYPFHSGSQDADWQNYNCSRCKKGYEHNGDKFVCDIDEALQTAFWEDGSVSEDIALRMGAIEQKGYYCWRCPEFEECE